MDNQYKLSKEELRRKLREKRDNIKLHRTSKLSRENTMEKLESKLKETNNSEVKKKLKEKLKLLEKVEEEEMNRYTGDFPEYSDYQSSGGTMERPD